MQKTALIFLANTSLLAVMLITPTESHAVTLSTLLAPGASIQVGSLTFDNFAFAEDGDMPPATAINVVPTAAADGLLLQGAFLDFVGGPGSHATIAFHVTAAPGTTITAASLAGNPAIIGQGTFTLTESFAQTPSFLEIYNNTGGPTKLTDQLSGLSNSTLTVSNLMQVSANSNVATLSFFTPTFQVKQVPEPAGAMLFGMGLFFAAAGTISRNRHTNKNLP